MSEMQLGVVQPQNIQQASALGSAAVNSRQQANRAQAMARHPAAGSRSAEFHAAAQHHLNLAMSNESRLQSIVSQGESMPDPGTDRSMAQYN